ncbi:MAG: hypothetical protein IJB86_01505 [Clostridia bacterium]|nr:hypothetical protein [Clostridia bacterium]
MKCIKFDCEKKYIRDFLSLPKKLYTDDNMEDEGDVKALLNGTHTMSSYFRLDKFIIYGKNETPVGRFAITTYPDDKTAYIGFFECINDSDTAKFLFDSAYAFAEKNGYDKIVGPVDASFWIKYRLKINMFDRKPYTGEPYNKDYYYKLFKENGYSVQHHYTSNLFKPLDETYTNELYENRFDEFTKKGYKIISPDIKDFDNILNDLYYLLTELYSDFPVFKNVEKNDFLKMFDSYRIILNLSMVKLAYYEEKMVGFFISVPNYNNLVYHLNPLNILKIMKIKKHPAEYVMMYMGVDQNHRGLGKAIVHSIIEELKVNKLTGIGALARDGKVTQTYGSDKIDSVYEYVLLERDINV